MTLTEIQELAAKVQYWKNLQDCHRKLTREKEITEWEVKLVADVPAASLYLTTDRLSLLRMLSSEIDYVREWLVSQGVTTTG